MKFQLNDVAVAKVALEVTNQVRHNPGQRFELTDLRLVEYFNANSKYYYVEFRTDNAEVCRMARSLMMQTGDNYEHAARRAGRRLKRVARYSADWQFWEAVQLKLWRKNCGIALRDHRSKPETLRNLLNSH